MLILAFFLAYGAAIVTAVLVLRGSRLRESTGFQVFALSWALGTGMFLNFQMGGGPGFIFAALPLGLIWGASFAYFFASFFMKVRGWGMGDAKIKVEPTFDQAEAAEKRQDWVRALELYRLAAEANPSHAETRRRLGEAYLRSGDPDSGIMELRAAMGMVEDPEKKVTVAFRVVDLLMSTKKDTFNAELILRSLEKDYAGTKVADLSRSRRERLKQS